MNSENVDLYTSFGLDPGDDTDALRLLLSGRDARMEAQGLTPDHPQRQQLQTAYAVLGNEQTRRTYDTAVLERRPMNWNDVSHLGNFGSLPQVDPFQPHPQAAPPAGPIKFNQTSPQQPTGYAGQPGYAPPVQTHSDRPSAGLRLGMVLLDGLLVSAAAGMASVMFFWSEALVVLISALVMVLYVVGFETKTGATPAKHIFGYEVRDIETGAKPSIEQSAKRNWWRLVSLVPGLGGLISVIGMVAIGSSITPEKGNLGSHDRWAGTEVAPKRS